jgi:mono/diheme cytochrome c family protein
MTNPSLGRWGRVLGGLAGLLALTAFVTPALRVPNERSVWSGVYTQTQAERGRETFEASCAVCHKADLSGRGPIPALRGSSFTDARQGETVGDLFERIRSSMPPTRPGSLTPEAYADVVAYLLSANSFPAGDGDLPSHEGALHGIVFDEGAAASD